MSLFNSRSEYLKVINSFSDHTKDEKFVFSDVDWWPLIKIQVSYQLHLLMTKDLDKSINCDFVSQKIHQNRLKLIDCIRSLLLCAVALNKKSKVAVFTSSNNVSKKASSNELINQFTDPFLDYFSQLNIEFDVYDIYSSRNNKPDLTALRRYYQHHITEEFNNDHSFQTKIMMVNDFFLNKIGNSFIIYNLLTNAIINCQTSYLTYFKFFKRHRYSHLLYYNYSSSEMMGINRAARQLKIKTIEYQHSNISNEHFAYTGWDKRISQSENFFPSVFWVWRDSDLKLIENNFAFLRSSKAIKGGNVFLARYKSLYPRKQSSEIKILITLQGIGIPNFLKEYIAENKNIFWYLRLHPRYPLDKLIAENLHNQCSDNTDIEKSNSLSLYELLADVNYHMTCFSGSALEAQSLGVQNIIYGEDGYNAYKENIENKTFFFVRNSKELEKILTENLLSDYSFDNILTEENSIKQILSTLIKKS